MYVYKYLYLNYVCMVYTSIGLHQSVSPSHVPVPEEDIFLPPSMAPLTLKEGIVEKRGHSVSFLMWPELVLYYCCMYEEGIYARKIRWLALNVHAYTHVHSIRSCIVYVLCE